MTRKEYLAALMLAGFSAMSMAQTGGSASALGVPLGCQGLIGGVMAQCVQGIGSGRAASETPRQEGRTPAVRETARSGTEPPVGAASSSSAPNGSSSVGASIGSAISGLFSGWGSSSAGKRANCQGLVGGAMAQCVQGIGSGSGNASGGSSIAATADAANDNAGSISTNFSIGNNSLKCQDLAGGAMAQCLRGM